MLLARVMRVGVTVQARQHVHMLPRQFTKGSRWSAAAAINLPTMVAGNDKAVAPKQQQLWAWQVPQQRHLVDVRQFHCTALAALASKASRAAAQEAQEAASVGETDGAGTAGMMWSCSDTCCVFAHQVTSNTLVCVCVHTDVSPKKGRRGGRAKVKRQCNAEGSAKHSQQAVSPLFWLFVGLVYWCWCCAAVSTTESTREEARALFTSGQS